MVREGADVVSEVQRAVVPDVPDVPGAGGGSVRADGRSGDARADAPAPDAPHSGGGRPDLAGEGVRRALAQYKEGRRARRKGLPVPAGASDPWKRGYLRVSRREVPEVAELDRQLAELAAREANPVADPVEEVVGRMPDGRPAPAPAAVPDALLRRAPPEPAAAPPGAAPVAAGVPAEPPPERQCADCRFGAGVCQKMHPDGAGGLKQCGKDVCRRLTPRMAAAYARVVPVRAARMYLKTPAVPEPRPEYVAALAEFIEELSEYFPLAGKWGALAMVVSMTFDYVESCAVVVHMEEQRRRARLTEQRPEAKPEAKPEESGDGLGGAEELHPPAPATEDPEADFWGVRRDESGAPVPS